MNRIIQTIDKSVTTLPASPVVVAAGVSQLALTDMSQGRDEIVGRELYNVGTNPCYYCYGLTCDNVTTWNGVIAVGQMLSTETCGPVAVFSVGGCTLGVTVLRRADLVARENIVPNLAGFNPQN